jgi:hypothetical protein
MLVLPVMRLPHDAAVNHSLHSMLRSYAAEVSRICTTLQYAS